MRLIAAGLLGGVALLLCELRFEHREALGETWHSWIPLVYAGTTLAAGLLALSRWDAGGRRVLGLFFAAGFAVGLAGLWFHTGGHPLREVRAVLAIWGVPIGRDGGIKQGSRPPALAPLAFCGLGTLGVLACFSPPARRAG
jgi:hypothetical protein